MRISPLPSMFGGRDSSVITCSCWSWSSAASSIVTIRSSSGTNDDMAFSIVVLPVPVPPEMRTFSFPFTQAARNCAACGVTEPNVDQVVHRVRIARELPDRERRALAARAAG